MADADLDVGIGFELVTAAGRPATYTAPSGPPIATVCALQQGMLQAGDGSRLEQVRIAHLPKLHVPEPLRGAVISIGTANWLIDAVEDDDGAIVAVRVRPT